MAVGTGGRRVGLGHRPRYLVGQVTRPAPSRSVAPVTPRSAVDRRRQRSDAPADRPPPPAPPPGDGAARGESGRDRSASSGSNASTISARKRGLPICPQSTRNRCGSATPERTVAVAARRVPRRIGSGQCPRRAATHVRRRSRGPTRQPGLVSARRAPAPLAERVPVARYPTGVSPSARSRTAGSAALACHGRSGRTGRGGHRHGSAVGDPPGGWSVEYDGAASRSSGCT